MNVQGQKPNGKPQEYDHLDNNQGSYANATAPMNPSSNWLTLLRNNYTSPD